MEGGEKARLSAKRCAKGTLEGVLTVLGNLLGRLNKDSLRGAVLPFAVVEGSDTELQ